MKCSTLNPDGTKTPERLCCEVCFGKMLPPLPPEPPKEDLLKRAFDTWLTQCPRSQYVWVAARNLFCVGSTRAHEICRMLGYKPEREVGDL